MSDRPKITHVGVGVDTSPPVNDPSLRVGRPTTLTYEERRRRVIQSSIDYWHEVRDDEPTPSSIEVITEAIDRHLDAFGGRELCEEVERLVDPEDCIHTHELDERGRHMGKAVPRKQEEWAALWNERDALRAEVEKWKRKYEGKHLAVACTCGHVYDEHDPQFGSPCLVEDCPCCQFENDR